MGKWQILHSDGTPLKDVNGNEVVAKEIEYSGTWMGECFVTVTFKHACPIELSIGDYLMYRGEKFEINYDPGKLKQSRKDSYGAAFVYDSVKFNALSDELARTEFLDIVLGRGEQKDLHYTSLPKFPFYMETLDDLLDRVQANLNKQWGEGAWKIYSRNLTRSSNRGCDETEWNKVYAGLDDNVIDSVAITADNMTCWDALALVNSKFDVNFIVRGRNVYVGTAGLPTSIIYQYGKGNGLTQIEQTADSDQAICTLLRAYGSTKNLPNHYYADVGDQYCFAISSKLYTDEKYRAQRQILLDIKWREGYWTVPYTQMTGYYKVRLTTQNGDNGVKITIPGTVHKDADTGNVMFYSSVLSDGDISYDYIKSNLEKFNTYAVQLKNKVFIDSDHVSGVLPDAHVASMLPDNMSISNLMLPGFPKKTLKEWWDGLTDAQRTEIHPQWKEHQHIFSDELYYPYVKSKNVTKIGIRPASVFFDREDLQTGLTEIYPTIEKMEVNGVRIDVIDEAEQITDNGRFKDGATIPSFYLYLNSSVNFDLTKLIQKSTETPTIIMKDGMNSAREFEITATNKVGGRWKLTCNRVHDDSLDLYFPYNDYQIKKGDHFVLVGIPLPDEYVEAASIKLLKYALNYLDKNDYTRYIYSPKIDNVYMKRQDDSAQASKGMDNEIVSFHDTIKEGDFFQFKDDDLHISANISIDVLTIKEAEGRIPQYEITLREDKSVGTIQKLTERIDSLYSGNGGAGGGSGVSNSQISRIVESTGSKNFLSKLYDDVAKGKITFEDIATFLKDVVIKGGLAVGDNRAARIDEKGNATFPSVSSDTIKDFTGLTSKEASDDPFTGHGLVYKQKNGSGSLTIDVLNVRKKATFNELEIRKLSYIGGRNITSNAGSKVQTVERLDANMNVIPDSDTTTQVCAYKVWLVSDDGTTATRNYWKVGDQARMQTFDIKKNREDLTATNGNRYFWRVVIDCDMAEFKPTEDADTKYLSYIVLANTPHAEVTVEYATGKTYKPILDGYDTSAINDAPKAEDAVVQMGNQLYRLTLQEDASLTADELKALHAFGQLFEGRTGWLEDDAEGVRRASYYHVTDFSTEGRETFENSPARTLIKTGHYALMRDDSKDTVVPFTLDMGVFTVGESIAYPHERWSYGGQLLIWNGPGTFTGKDKDGKTIEPSTDTGWELQVEKGGQGKGAQRYYVLCNPDTLHRSADGKLYTNLDKAQYLNADGTVITVNDASGNPQYYIVEVSAMTVTGYKHEAGSAPVAMTANDGFLITVVEHSADGDKTYYNTEGNAAGGKIVSGTVTFQPSINATGIDVTLSKGSVTYDSHYVGVTQDGKNGKDGEVGKDGKDGTNYSLVADLSSIATDGAFEPKVTKLKFTEKVNGANKAWGTVDIYMMLKKERPYNFYRRVSPSSITNTSMYHTLDLTDIRLADNDSQVSASALASIKATCSGSGASDEVIVPVVADGASAADTPRYYLKDNGSYLTATLRISNQQTTTASIGILAQALCDVTICMAKNGTVSENQRPDGYYVTWDCGWTSDTIEKSESSSAGEYRSAIQNYTYAATDTASLPSKMTIRLYDGNKKVVDEILISLAQTTGGAEYFDTINGIFTRMCMDDQYISRIRQTAKNLELKIHDSTKNNNLLPGSKNLKVTASNEVSFTLGAVFLQKVQDPVSLDKDQKYCLTVKAAAKSTPTDTPTDPTKDVWKSGSIKLYVCDKKTTSSDILEQRSLDLYESDGKVSAKYITISASSDTYATFTPTHSGEYYIIGWADVSTVNAVIDYITLWKGITKATAWTPANDDDRLLDTGVDIADRKVRITSDNFLVQSNTGYKTLEVTEDGKIGAKSIEAQKVVTEALQSGTITAGKATIENLKLTNADLTGTITNGERAGSFVQVTFGDGKLQTKSYATAVAGSTGYGFCISAGNTDWVYTGTNHNNKLVAHAYIGERARWDVNGNMTGYTAAFLADVNCKASGIDTTDQLCGFGAEMSDAGAFGFFTNGRMRANALNLGVGSFVSTETLTSKSPSVIMAIGGNITFPSDATVGQMFIIIQTNTTRVNFHGKFRRGSKHQTSCSSNAEGRINVFIFDGDEWHCGYLAGNIF